MISIGIKNAYLYVPIFLQFVVGSQHFRLCLFPLTYMGSHGSSPWCYRTLRGSTLWDIWMASWWRSIPHRPSVPMFNRLRVGPQSPKVSLKSVPSPGVPGPSLGHCPGLGTSSPRKGIDPSSSCSDSSCQEASFGLLLHEIAWPNGDLLQGSGVCPISLQASAAQCWLHGANLNLWTSSCGCLPRPGYC